MYIYHLPVCKKNFNMETIAYRDTTVMSLQIEKYHIAKPNDRIACYNSTIN